MSASIYDQGRKGDLRISFEWGSRAEETRRQPMMRLRNPLMRRSWLIFMDDAHLWDHSDGAAADKRVAMKCIEVAAHLYGFPTSMDATRVRDAVLEWLPDLLRMPPHPMQTPLEFQQKLEAHGVVLKMTHSDGSSMTLLDARG